MSPVLHHPGSPNLKISISLPSRLLLWFKTGSNQCFFAEAMPQRTLLPCRYSPAQPTPLLYRLLQSKTGHRQSSRLHAMCCGTVLFFSWTLRAVRWERVVPSLLRDRDFSSFVCWLPPDWKFYWFIAVFVGFGEGLSFTLPIGPCHAGYWCREGASSPSPLDGLSGSLCPPGQYCPSGYVISLLISNQPKMTPLVINCLHLKIVHCRGSSYLDFYHWCNFFIG